MQVVDQNGRSVSLDAPFAQGAEGEIRRLHSDPARVAKLFRRPSRVQADKIRAMVATPPLTKGQRGFALAWPESSLYRTTGQREFVGYVMPLVSGALLHRTLVRVQNDRLMCPAYAVKAAENIAAMFAAVHGAGLIIGDVNEKNLLVASDGKVSAVDTDSFQVRAAGRTFFCNVGRPEYTAPELQGANLSKTEREPHHDNFALGVVLFQLLMQGDHPFRARYTGPGNPPPLHVRIKQGNWPYAARPFATYSPPTDPRRFHALPQEIQCLFRQAFEDGHREPSFRPTADDWRHALTQAAGQWPTQASIATPTRKIRVGGGNAGWRAIKRITRTWIPPAAMTACGGGLIALVIWGGMAWSTRGDRDVPRQDSPLGMASDGEPTPQLWKRFSEEDHYSFWWEK